MGIIGTDEGVVVGAHELPEGHRVAVDGRDDAPVHVDAVVSFMAVGLMHKTTVSSITVVLSREEETHVGISWPGSHPLPFARRN